MDAYATPQQLATYLEPGATDPEPPADAARLLREATLLVEGYVLAGYAVDRDTLRPTDEKVAQALANAACAQVDYWGVVSEEHDKAGVTTGTMSAGGITHNMPKVLGPRARRELDLAGLRTPGWVGPRFRRPLDRSGRHYS